MKRNIYEKKGIEYMAGNDKANLAVAVSYLALSMIFAFALYSSQSAAWSITGAATQGSGEVRVMVLDEVIQAVSGGGGGAGAVEGICDSTCTFGETRCYQGDMNICTPIFQQNEVCGVWMLIDCPGECIDGRCSECIPNWQPFPWSDCSPDGVQVRTLVDYNGCYAELPERTEYRNCDYVPACDDGIRNGMETGIDCGGECPECEIPAEVAPEEYVCGDGKCGIFEMCWGDCKTKMSVIPAALIILVSMMYIIPYIMMNMGGDYSTYHALKHAVSKIESGNFTSANRIFMTKVEPKIIDFMARYTSGNRLHKAIESLYSEAKMYLQAHEAELSKSVKDSKRMKSALKEAKKLASRFEKESPSSSKAYGKFKELMEGLKK